MPNGGARGGGGEPAHLFVYGTLMASIGGAMHDVVAGRATLVGRASIAGRLYDAGMYPAAVASPSSARDRVRGELYALHPRTSAELLRELDEYEGCAEGLFRRERAAVVDEQRRPAEAWVYLYARPVSGLRRIEAGDWAADRLNVRDAPPDDAA